MSQARYDKAGRVTWTGDNDKNTNYTYYTSGKNNGKVEKIAGDNGIARVFRYDDLGRLKRLADSIQGEVSMVTRYGYDAWSHNTTITYPSDIIVTNVYDSKGYVSQINNGSSILWKMNSSDSRGRPVNYNLGDPNFGLGVQFTYDPQGRLATKSTVQMKQTYVFDPNSGNLSSRDYRTAGSQTGLYESFGYDSQNRLNFIARGTATDTVKYFDNGNIDYKKNVGDYTYDPAKIHAVKSIDVKGGTINQTEQSITYNALNLTTQITQGATVYNIKYNPFNERIKTINNTTAVTKYYSGDYEKKTTSGVTKEYHYINSPYGLVAIIESIGTAIQNTWYVETDHLGSIIGLLRSDKSYAANLSFDAWGRRRNPANWTYQGFTPTTLTDRGFTGHEHLDWAGLINANGRMYDPVIGRFLGVDPIVADGDNSQSFNSYTYALNNPLRLIDRDGFQYEEPYSGGPFVASISTWSLDTWREMRRLAKENKELTYLDCVGIATGYLDSEDVLLQRLLQLQYGPQGQGVRPDGDGYLTLDEANYWYNNGNGQPLSADLSKINLRSVSVDDFKKTGDSKYFNLLFYSNSRNDGLVYGSIKLTYMGPTWNEKGGIVSAEYDIYDFDLRDWNSVGNAGRNMETIIGSQVAGPGTAYRINFLNYGPISGPRPPVIY